MIALLGALREEVDYLQRRLRLPEVVGGPTCDIHRGMFQGCDTLLVRTGIGRQRADAATRFVIERFPVTMVVSFGFAGALHDELKAGDVVLCSRLSCTTGGTRTALPADVEIPTQLLARARDILDGKRISVRYGGCLTSSELITDPERKRVLGRTFSADIADMESYWVAAAASENQVPTLVIRSISDARTDEMPPFTQLMTPDGGWRLKETAAYFLRRPARMAALLPLYRNTRKAGVSLATVITALIDEYQGVCR